MKKKAFLCRLVSLRFAILRIFLKLKNIKTEKNLLELVNKYNTDAIVIIVYADTMNLFPSNGKGYKTLEGNIHCLVRIKENQYNF